MLLSELWLGRLVSALLCAGLLACFGVRGSVGCMCAGAISGSGLFLWALYQAGRLPIQMVRNDTKLYPEMYALKGCTLLALWMDHLMLDLVPLVGWALLSIVCSVKSVHLWGSVVLDFSLVAFVCQLFSIFYQTRIGNFVIDLREDLEQRGSQGSV